MSDYLQSTLELKITEYFEKYIEGNGNQTSYCQGRKLQIEKREKLEGALCYGLEYEWSHEFQYVERLGVWHLILNIETKINIQVCAHIWICTCMCISIQYTHFPNSAH